MHPIPCLTPPGWNYWAGSSSIPGLRRWLSWIHSERCQECTSWPEKSRGFQPNIAKVCKGGGFLTGMSQVLRSHGPEISVGGEHSSAQTRGLGNSPWCPGMALPPCWDPGEPPCWDPGQPVVSHQQTHLTLPWSTQKPVNARDIQRRALSINHQCKGLEGVFLAHSSPTSAQGHFSPSLSQCSAHI